MGVRVSGKLRQDGNVASAASSGFKSLGFSLFGFRCRVPNLKG